MGMTLQNALPVGMLLNATVATIFLILSIVFLILTHNKSDPNKTWDGYASLLFFMIFAVLSISTALAVRNM